MNQPAFIQRRYLQAQEEIAEQADALKRARHLIWTLFVLLALVSFALGAVWAQLNFATQ